MKVGDRVWFTRDDAHVVALPLYVRAIDLVTLRVLVRQFTWVQMREVCVTSRGWTT